MLTAVAEWQMLSIFLKNLRYAVTFGPLDLPSIRQAPCGCLPEAHVGLRRLAFCSFPSLSFSASLSTRDRYRHPSQGLVLHGCLRRRSPAPSRRSPYRLDFLAKTCQDLAAALQHGEPSGASCCRSRRQQHARQVDSDSDQEAPR